MLLSSWIKALLLYSFLLSASLQVIENPSLVGLKERGKVGTDVL